MCSKLVFLLVAGISLIAIAQAAAPTTKKTTTTAPVPKKPAPTTAIPKKTPSTPPRKQEGDKGKDEGCQRMNLTACCPTLPAILSANALRACKPAEPTVVCPIPTAGTTPPPPGGNLNCAMECAFAKQNLLTTTTPATVDLALLDAYLTTLDTPEWSTILTEAKAQCTAVAPVIDADAVCKSGACEIMRCLSKYLMSKCPSIVNTAECKKRVEGISDMCKPGCRPPKKG